jgi:AraC-like DNA-binding protein
MSDNPYNQAIEVFEKYSGLSLSIRDYEGLLWHHIDSNYFIHRHPICHSIKNHSLKKCSTFESDVLKEMNEQFPAGGIKKCFAGISECFVYHKTNGVINWILCSGPFTTTSNNVHVFDQQTKIKHTTSSLPKFSNTKSEETLELLKHLNARLKELVTKEINFDSLEFKVSPRIYIKRWIQFNHTNKIKISDLSKAIHLSESRTIHIVKELTGKTFIENLHECRLKTAINLIKYSDSTMESIAHSTGFGHVTLMYKSFKKNLLKTPFQYRKDNSI